MIYLFPLWSFVSFVSFFFFSSTTPLALNIWLSVFTGVFSLLLMVENNLTGALTLLMVEESLSLVMIFIWSMMGGSLLMMLVIIMKSALAPFHSWFVSVLSPCKSSTLIWGITFHKLPVVGVVVSFSFISSLTLLVFSLIMGVCFMMVLGGVNSMLILSSNNTFTSFVMLFCLSSSKGIVFFFIYIILLWSTFSYLSFSVSSLCLLLGFMGVPPLFLFQSKWMVAELLWATSPLQSFVLAAASGASSIIYMRLVFLINLELFVTQSVSFYLLWILLSVFLPTV